MLLAIAQARRSVHLEVYAFAPSGVGARFIEALGQAAGRGVKVQVQIDGWGSARGGRAVATALHVSGCGVRIYNRMLALLIGRFGRNHRRFLLVDDEVAFLGGINIGDENVDQGMRLAWADLALEIRGPQCAHLGQMIRREPNRTVNSSIRLFLCGLGGGWRLRRRYLKAFAIAASAFMSPTATFFPTVAWSTPSRRRHGPPWCARASIARRPLRRSLRARGHQKPLSPASWRGRCHPRMERLGPTRQDRHHRWPSTPRGQL